MEIIAALIALHCEQHFNYKGCVDSKVFCVNEYVSASLNKPRWSLYDKKVLSEKESRIVAQAYLTCAEPLYPQTCEQ